MFSFLPSGSAQSLDGLVSRTSVNGGAQFREFTYELWVSPDLPVDRPLRGLIAVIGDGGGPGGNLFSNAEWRALAAGSELGMLRMVHYAAGGGQALNAADGIWSALEKGLDDFATELKRPEIASLPILPIGHSNGGFQALEIATAKPERVIAAVAFHPVGNPEGSSLPLIPQDLPVLLVIGAKDRPTVNEPLFKELAPARLGRRLLTAQIQMLTEHHYVGNQDFALLWAAEILKLRLPQNAGGESGTALRSIEPSTGLLGELSFELPDPEFRTSLEVFGATTHAYPKPGASMTGEYSCWIPSASLADPWAETHAEQGQTPMRSQKIMVCGYAGAIKSDGGRDFVFTVTRSGVLPGEPVPVEAEFSGPLLEAVKPESRVVQIRLDWQKDSQSITIPIPSSALQSGPASLTLTLRPSGEADIGTPASSTVSVTPEQSATE